MDEELGDTPSLRASVSRCRTRPAEQRRARKSAVVNTAAICPHRSAAGGQALGVHSTRGDSGVEAEGQQRTSQPWPRRTRPLRSTSEGFAATSTPFPRPRYATQAQSQRIGAPGFIHKTGTRVQTRGCRGLGQAAPRFSSSPPTEGPRPPVTLRGLTVSPAPPGCASGQDGSSPGKRGDVWTDFCTVRGAAHGS